MLMPVTTSVVFLISGTEINRDCMLNLLICPAGLTYPRQRIFILRN